ncbi:fatty acid desaturase-domain-containing protein [Pyronema domesticum]|nr:fatty acid desaturase-domain-containing protein [Pyronema domesticum]
MGLETLLNPQLQRPDVIVLKNLIRDANAPAVTKTNGTSNGNGHAAKPVNGKANGAANYTTNTTPGKSTTSGPGFEAEDEETIKVLTDINNPKLETFEPSIFSSFDVDLKSSNPLIRFLVKPYFNWARTVVRRETDVVFLTHILIYCFINAPSALWLFYSFSWPHAIAHGLFTAISAGPFTLMLHNHIHNNGVLKPAYGWFDQSFPYVLEPLMGHSWDSYYYHHVKHHHIEGNGPGDLSSTVRYQRDNALHFLHYLFRFMLLVWIELPIYFIKKGRYGMAARVFVSESTTYTIYFLLAKWRFLPTLWVFLIPIFVMRTAMMVGNWGQHAFVDEVEPDSDFRSSITLIDVTSNRHCFNDGYHTSHHLNPLRHWRDHPVALIKAKKQYADGRALTFADIDYL